MALEGVILYLMLVKIFRRKARPGRDKLVFLLCGWGTFIQEFLVLKTHQRLSFNMFWLKSQYNDAVFFIIFISNITTLCFYVCCFVTGLPAIVVAASAALFHEGYGTREL